MEIFTRFVNATFILIIILEISAKRKEKSGKNLIPCFHLSHVILLILNNRKSKYLQTLSSVPSFLRTQDVFSLLKFINEMC